MTAPTSSASAGLVRVARVDGDGRIPGLGDQPGEAYLLVKWPSIDAPGFDDLRRAGEELAVGVADWAQASRTLAEERAAKLARELDLDPEEARKTVRAATAWVDELLQAVQGAVGGATRESADERRALGQVALAASEGASDWTPRPEPPEAAAPGSRVASVDAVWAQQLARKAEEGPPDPAGDVARKVREGVHAVAARATAPIQTAQQSREDRKALGDAAEAARWGATGWQPRDEPPEAALPGSTVLPEDREPDDLARRVPPADEPRPRKRKREP
ncbi:MAG TPA: hypothetical protein VGR28_12665 [Candidatus Thermoplasmatota archaeon]|jgi:hypothetical protein|nr:hypothetical protein [Candidatus Thermoplasmatota archaeon]